MKTIARRYIEEGLSTFDTTHLAMYNIDAIMTAGMTEGSQAYLFKDGSALFEHKNKLYLGGSEWKGDHHLHTLGKISWRSK